MKKVLSIFAVVLTLAACKSKKSDIPSNMVLVDTTGLSKSSALTDVGDKKYVITPTAEAPRKVGNSGGTGHSGTSGNSGTSNAPVNNMPAEPVQRDKVLSDAAKGTAIGAGSGAILGAVVAGDGNRGKGAVIGAVVGAGTGYAIGRSRDKKSGRVARKRAARRH